MDLVDGILANDEEVMVPVKKIWQMLQFDDEYEDISVPTLAEFNRLLKTDDRFEFMPPINYGNIYADLSKKEKEAKEIEMEAIGFFSGERVKLRRKKITGELLASMVERSVDRMSNGLKKIINTGLNNKEQEKRLLEVIKKTEQLQKQAEKIVKRLREEEKNRESL